MTRAKTITKMKKQILQFLFCSDIFAKTFENIFRDIISYPKKKSFYSYKKETFTFTFHSILPSFV